MQRSPSQGAEAELTLAYGRDFWRVSSWCHLPLDARNGRKPDREHTHALPVSQLISGKDGMDRAGGEHPINEAGDLRRCLNAPAATGGTRNWVGRREIRTLNAVQLRRQDSRARV